MTKRKWTEIKHMSDEEVKQTFKEVAKAVEQLAEYVGHVDSAIAEEDFSAGVADCIDLLYSLRTRVQSAYYKVGNFEEEN